MSVSLVARRHRHCAQSAVSLPAAVRRRRAVGGQRPRGGAGGIRIPGLIEPGLRAVAAVVKKALENEILREALDLAQPKRLLRSPSPTQDDTP
jgi:hypothetical protein